MADVQHEALTEADGIHTIVSALPANAAARAALGWGVGDLGKVAYQLDTRAFWLLRGDGAGGVAWLELGNAADIAANTTSIGLLSTDIGNTNAVVGGHTTLLATHTGQIAANTSAISGKAAVTNSAPAQTTKATAVVGVATDAARADHKHDVSTAAATTIGTANTEGSATSLARSDHGHDHGNQAGGALHADVIAGGASGFMTGTQATKLAGIATAAAALTSSAPAQTTKAAAVVGVDTTAARADHKHDVSTAVVGTLGDANAEGSATSLARSDHVHLAKRRIWTWANTAARLAQSVVAGQIGLIGYQTDMDLEYVLLAVTPAVRWGRLEDPSMGPWAQFFGAQGGTSNNGLNIGNVVVGTIGQRSPASTNRSTARMRASFTTAASLAATGYFRIGGGSTLGSTAFGFRYRATYIPAVVSASMRWVYGIYDILGASTNQAPTVVTNALAIGADLSVSANLKVYYNDAAGAASSIDLGASFPGGTANVGYEVEFYSADGSTITYNVLNLNTGAETSGTLTTDIPTTSALLQHGCFESNNTDSTAISVDFSYVQFSNRNR